MQSSFLSLTPTVFVSRHLESRRLGIPCLSWRGDIDAFLEEPKMRALGLIVLLGGGLLAAIGHAAPPAGTTGLCKDGTYYSGPTTKGACRGHKGLKEWYGAAPEAAAPGNPAPAAAKPTTAPAPSTGAKTTAAPSGGVGKVWVNKSTKVYHCPGDRWYGKTKTGEYMSEADAKAQGFKPDRGKACQ
jgi:hypothetical protein